MADVYVRLGEATYIAAPQALANDGLRATVHAALRERRGELHQELKDVGAAIALLARDDEPP